MRVVFSRLQNCPGFSDDDFKEDGSAFQHVGPEAAKALYAGMLMTCKTQQNT